LPSTPQFLRYTHIVHAHRSGQSIGTIAQQVGLAQRRVTEIIGGAAPATPSPTPTLTTRDELVLATLRATACTTQQLSSLQATDVSHGAISIGKQRVQVSKELSDALTTYAQTHGQPALFATRQSATITARRVQQITKEHNTTPHRLRAQALRDRTPDEGVRVSGLSPRRVAALRAEVQA
jgi:hypothetical protein